MATLANRPYAPFIWASDILYPQVLKRWQTPLSKLHPILHFSASESICCQIPWMSRVVLKAEKSQETAAWMLGPPALSLLTHGPSGLCFPNLLRCHNCIISRSYWINGLFFSERFLHTSFARFCADVNTKDGLCFRAFLAVSRLAALHRWCVCCHFVCC